MKTVKNDTINAAIEFILNNIPETIGIAIGFIILGLLAAMWKKIVSWGKRLFKKGKKNVPISNDSALIKYLSALIKRGSALSFGDPASYSMGSTDNEDMVTLEQIWTPLRVADSEMRKG